MDSSNLLAITDRIFDTATFFSSIDFRREGECVFIESLFSLEIDSERFVSKQEVRSFLTILPLGPLTFN